MGFKRKENIPRDEIIQFLMECLLVFIAVVSMCVAFPYTTIFLLEDADAFRRLVYHAFGITVTLQVKYIPLIFHMFFQTLQCSNLISYCLTMGALFNYSTKEWLMYLTSRTLRSRKSSKPAQDKMGSIRVFEQSIDTKVVSSYQVLQVQNRLLNVVDGTIWIAFHHAALLGISVISFFGSIRWTNYFSKFTVGGLIFAGGLCILIMYVEVLLCCILPDSSGKLLGILHSKYKRNSIFGKRVRAFKLIKWGIGKPFYTLSHFSFLIFIEQLMSFLFTLLLSVE